MQAGKFMSIAEDFMVAWQEPVQNMSRGEVGVTDKLFWTHEVFWGNGSKGRCAAANADQKPIRLFLWVVRAKRAVLFPLPEPGSVLQKNR